MLNIGFYRSIKDACVYFKRLENGYWVFLLLYVDDMFIAFKDTDESKKLKSHLKSNLIWMILVKQGK